jgi:hypothetical protein
MPATGSGNSPTGRSRCPVKGTVMNVNRFVRGWAAYFRNGNSTWAFDKITVYMRMRLAPGAGHQQTAQPVPRLRSFGAASNHRTSSAGLSGVIEVERNTFADSPANSPNAVTCTYIFWHCQNHAI